MFGKQRVSSQTVGESEFKIALETSSEASMHREFQRNWMNPEMQTTLLNTYPPKLIATILKALREQLKENDQMNAVEEIADPVSEILLEYDQNLERRRKILGRRQRWVSARRSCVGCET